ncbi:hypothetical protein WIS52_12390 [Pseudonocardia nematodicida]|uniref:Uncharacterized protein n=1 Tax=Pseudonocardia nematodicida TaxID=1206997 RepID=A0ABV1KAU6_9PSEU
MSRPTGGVQPSVRPLPEEAVDDDRSGPADTYRDPGPATGPGPRTAGPSGTTGAAVPGAATPRPRVPWISGAVRRPDARPAPHGEDGGDAGSGNGSASGGANGSDSGDRNGAPPEGRAVRRSRRADETDGGSTWLQQEIARRVADRAGESGRHARVEPAQGGERPPASPAGVPSEADAAPGPGDPDTATPVAPHDPAPHDPAPDGTAAPAPDGTAAPAPDGSAADGDAWRRHRPRLRAAGPRPRSTLLPDPYAPDGVRPTDDTGGWPAGQGKQWPPAAGSSGLPRRVPGATSSWSQGWAPNRTALFAGRAEAPAEAPVAPEHTPEPPPETAPVRTGRPGGEDLGTAGAGEPPAGVATPAAPSPGSLPAAAPAPGTGTDRGQREHAGFPGISDPDGILDDLDDLDEDLDGRDDLDERDDFEDLDSDDLDPDDLRGPAVERTEVIWRAPGLDVPVAPAPTPDPAADPTASSPELVVPGPEPYTGARPRRFAAAATDAPAPDPGTAGEDEAGGRVRIVLSERRSTAHSSRGLSDVQDPGTVGTVLRNSLVRSQLLLSLRVGMVALIGLGLLPALFMAFPVLGGIAVLGIRLPWLLLGLLVYPFLLGLGWWFVTSAESVEQEFADDVADR